MSQLLIQLEKFKVTLDDINLLEEELQLLWWKKNLSIADYYTIF
jgi:hypothetical protein